ncbi:MAG: aminopeptidase P family N-terminal domain-containing protein, partial [Alphaproteobacteria bacterium]|nr:aminopeptidase P family N-terminal domain-containing protein [Alphaproteobacteria bacterium]
MLSKIRENLKKLKLDAILINSTNEFLVEYNSLEENARYILTGFSGSTGDAVVTENNLYLFVDGRYHIQADNEVNHDIVTVVKLQNGETFNSKLTELLPEKSVLGIVGSKNSQTRRENLQKFYTVKILDSDFISVKFPENLGQNETVCCGMTTDEKLGIVRTYIEKNDAILVSNLEEVSYLFNLRNFSQNYSSKILARAIITKEKAELFYPENFTEYKTALEQVKGFIYLDKGSTNVRDYGIIGEKAKPWDKNPIQQMKAVKTEDEIKSYKDAFQNTDNAVKAIREFIYSHDNISEYDIDKQLEYEFKKYGAKNLSFKSIVAKDQNSALAHYS